MKIFTKRLLTGRTFLTDKTVTVENGRITATTGGGPADFAVDVLTPGLVDLHCHGGQGFDPEQVAHPLPDFLAAMLRCGVTEVLLTLGAESLPVMRRALGVVKDAMQKQAAGQLPGTRIIGVHLEGPFLSPVRPGAMPPAALRIPSSAAYRELTLRISSARSLLRRNCHKPSRWGSRRQLTECACRPDTRMRIFPPHGELLMRALQGCATHSTPAGRCTTAIPALWLLRCWMTVLPPSAFATLFIYTPEHCS